MSVISRWRDRQHEIVNAELSSLAAIFKGQLMRIVRRAIGVLKTAHVVFYESKLHLTVRYYQLMILVVIDDDTANIKFVPSFLANEGLENSCGRNPQAAWKLIINCVLQIVLLTLVMPGVQGMEVLQKILEFDPGIDRHLETGYYSTNRQWKAIHKGAADLFSKSFSTRQAPGRDRPDKGRFKHRHRSFDSWKTTS